MNTGIIHFEAFLIAATLFIVSPGIDTMFVLNKSLTQGKKAGILSTLGINAGVIVHTLVAALGLSWLLAQSATAFLLIKYLGAIYLIFIGVKGFIGRDQKEKNDIEREKKEYDNRQHFVNGLVVNVFNPKVALFFLSFFPQFIAPDAIHQKTPFILLGIAYAMIGILWFLLVALLSAKFAVKVKENPKVKTMMDKCSGVIFILMGLKIALSKK